MDELYELDATDFCHHSLNVCCTVCAGAPERPVLVWFVEDDDE